MLSGSDKNKIQGVCGQNIYGWLEQKIWFSCKQRLGASVHKQTGEETSLPGKTSGGLALPGRENRQKLHGICPKLVRGHYYIQGGPVKITYFPPH